MPPIDLAVGCQKPCGSNKEWKKQYGYHKRSLSGSLVFGPNYATGSECIYGSLGKQAFMMVGHTTLPSSFIEFPYRALMYLPVTFPCLSSKNIEIDQFKHFDSLGRSSLTCWTLFYSPTVLAELHTNKLRRR